jgi:formamidopyrimidine-DNA glycosylase
MPELPEVEVARRIAERTLVGQTIARVTAADDRIVYSGVTPRRFAAAVRGRRVKAAHRRGKHLWLELDRRPWPLFHFGMGGGFHVYEKASQRPRFWKMELVLDDGTRLAMTNARRLGRIRLQHDPEHEPPISLLGFDPLLDLPAPKDFAALLAERRAAIKAVLLDQSFAAGVGNWVADEVLYQAGIAPHRAAAELSPQEARRLREYLRRVCRQAVAADADAARFPRHWLLHHRWNRLRNTRTARGEPIIHETIGGRTTAWAPAVQK